MEALEEKIGRSLPWWAWGGKTVGWVKVAQPTLFKDDTEDERVVTARFSLPSLSVMTMNVWFDPYCRDERFKAILEIIQTKQPLIVALQEVTRPFVMERLGYEPRGSRLAPALIKLPKSKDLLARSPYVRSSYHLSDAHGETIDYQGGYGCVFLLHRTLTLSPIQHKERKKAMGEDGAGTGVRETGKTSKAATTTDCALFLCDLPTVFMRKMLLMRLNLSPACDDDASATPTFLHLGTVHLDSTKPCHRSRRAQLQRCIALLNHQGVHTGARNTPQARTAVPSSEKQHQEAGRMSGATPTQNHETTSQVHVVRMLVGDFNFCSSWESEEKTVQESDMLDVWPSLHPDAQGFTEDTDINRMRWRFKRKTKRVRFDRVLIGYDEEMKTVLNQQPKSALGNKADERHYDKARRGTGQKKKVLPGLVVLQPAAIELVGTAPIPYSSSSKKGLLAASLPPSLDPSGTTQTLEEAVWPSDHFGLFTVFRRA